MAYTIKNCVNGAIVYDPRIDDLICVEPKLKRSDNAFGSLSFRMLRTHPDYFNINKRRTIYAVHKNDAVDPIFKGICINTNEDIDGFAEFYFEDFMSVLRDSMQEPFEFQGTPVDLLTQFLAAHNTQVATWQQIRLGHVTVTDPNDYINRSSQTELSTWNAIKTRLIDTLGGHLRMRYTGGAAYLDYLEGSTTSLDSYLNTSTQKIEFGENLKSFSRIISSAETYTACIPKGAEVEIFDEEGESHKQRITIEEVNGGSKYLINAEAVEQYGFRCAPIDQTTWDDVMIPANLKSKGLAFLNSTLVMLSNTIKLTAYDLKELGLDCDGIDFLDYLVVDVSPFNLSETYLLTTIENALDDDSEVNIVLGETTLSIADMQNKFQTNVEGKIENLIQNVTQLQNGRLLKSIEVFYAISDSPTELVNPEWSTTPPTWAAGLYIWTKSKSTYTDGTTSESRPVCITGNSGADGQDGSDGQDGIPGTNGVSQYFHIKYSPVAAPSAAQMIETPSTYIGTYVDNLPTDSSDPLAYTWTKWIGSDGVNGIPGTNGKDGKTYYLHIAYANNADGSEGFSTTDSTNKTYLGQYQDEIEADSDDPTKYKWSRIKGDQGIRGLQGKDGVDGIPGKDGVSSYFHIKYSPVASPTADQMVETPSEYIGTYVDSIQADSDDPTKYKWMKWQGQDGSNGLPGVNGENGQTSYLHVAYANSPDGTTDFSTSDSTDKEYIGQYTDFVEADSMNPAAYKWTKIRGNDGEDGKDGVDGEDGADGRGIASIEPQYYLSTSDTTPTGGEWSNTPPVFDANKWIWTRSKITYDNGDIEYTTAICDATWGAVGEEIAKVKVELQSAIEQTKESILLRVSEIYTSTTSLEEFKSQVSTLFEQTAQSFEMQFTTIEQTITTLDGAVSTMRAEQNKYIRFIDGDIYLGEENNPLILKISNDRISFFSNNVEIAYFASGRLYVDQIEAITSLTLGSYAFIPNKTGGMTLKYVGT